MSGTAFDIESVVREVIRRLTNGGNGRRAESGAVKRQHTDASTMYVTQQVVSLAQLEGRLDRVTRLVVPQRSIVTPAVCDELRRYGITLQRDCQTTEVAGNANSRWRVLMGGHGTDCDWRGLIAARPSERFDFELLDPEELEVLLRELDGRLLAQRTFGVIVSSVPHVVACQANRNPTFRAAVVGDANEATETRQSLYANLLAVHDTRVYRLPHIVSAAVRTEGKNEKNAIHAFTDAN